MPVMSGRMLPAHCPARGIALARMIGAAAVFDLAGAGIVYLAGLSRVSGVLAHVHWAWLVVLAGLLAVGFAGYFCAYQDISASMAVRLRPAASCARSRWPISGDC